MRTTTDRSLRTDVRNPILGLPAAAKLAALSPEARDALAAVLADIATDSRARADKCWRTHKAPMAAYWKACSVYAGHIRRALRGQAAPAPITEPIGAKPCASRNP